MFNILKFPYQDNWFRFLSQSSEFSLFVLDHPEFYFISEFFLKNFILPFSSNVDNVIYVMNDGENFLNPVLLFPHLLVIVFFITFFVLVYFSYYNSPVKEENTVDHDYLIASSTVESEEEIGSLDDMLLSILILSYIFL